MSNLKIVDIQKFAEIMHARFIHNAEPSSSREMAYGRMVKSQRRSGRISGRGFVIIQNATNR